MPSLRHFMIGLVAAVALILGAASQSLAACGNNVLDFDPIKGTNEECDSGQVLCAGGLRAGQRCSTAADCPGSTCTLAGSFGITGVGNRDDVDSACRSDCTLPACGDGVTDTASGFDEECDDGNTSNTDGCLNSCEEASCGDGFRCTENNPASPCDVPPLGGKENCDDGNSKDGDGCSALCVPEVCGDGTVGAAEQCDLGFAACDAGSLNAGDLCATDAECLGGDCDACFADIFAGLDATGASPHVLCTGNGPNSDDSPNTCRSDCTLPRCGDGVTDSTNGEQCDDGNTSNNDGCTNECLENTCGDGFRCSENNPDSPCASFTLSNGIGKEECDDGNRKNGDGCEVLCVLEECGDFKLQPGEQCDEGVAECKGGANDDGSCATNADCPNGVCFDNNDNHDNLPDHCRSDCTLPSCGDGVTDSGEDCDDGNTSNNDGCLTTCEENVCGDGFQCTENNPDSPCASTPDPYGKEECDDGNLKSNDGCDDTCSLESCGNGTIESGEQCDLGQATCTGGLRDEQPCASATDCPGAGATCADDPSNRDDLADHCRSNCQLPSCGDGTTDSDGTDGAEQCDDGNTSNNDTCLNNCRDALCGDGNLCSNDNLKNPNDGGNCDTGPGGGPEQCDDGNQENDDGCTTACALTSCGDGVVQSGEECDQGASSCQGGLADGQPCTASTQCFGSTCGTGNLNEADSCKSNCRLPACGDGVSDPGNAEECDTDPTAAGESCNDNCAANTCGDGVLGRSEVDLGGGPVVQQEGCDDGNTFEGDGCSAVCTVEACGDGITTQSFDPTEHEECDAGLPLQHPDPNGGPTPVQHQGNCTSVCCWFGGISPDGEPFGQESTPTLPVNTFLNVDGAFDSLTGCHLPKLIDNASCSSYVQRPSIRLSKLISTGRGDYYSNNFQKAIRKLRRAKRVIDRLDRALTKSRVAAACEAVSHTIMDQKNRIATINRDIQAAMPLF